MKHLMTMADVDTSKGIIMCGGTLELYKEVLQIFYSCGSFQLKQLKIFFLQQDWELLAVEAHALKSTAFGIGADSLGENALQMEFAAKEKNIAVIQKLMPELLQKYQTLLNEITSAMKIDECRQPLHDQSLNQQTLLDKLRLIHSQAEDYTLNEAGSIVEDLLQYPNEVHIQERLVQLREFILNFSYADTSSLTQELIEALLSPGQN